MRFKILFSKKYWWNLSTALFILAITSQGSVIAQDKRTLEANKKQIEKEIALTSSLLNQTRKSKKTSLLELQLVNRNIQKRKQLISGLYSQLALANNQIEKLSSTVSRLSGDIENLKKEYASMLQSSYLHRNQYSKMMFVLASSDFNQAFRRLRYIKQYSDYQKQQVDLIVAKQEALKTNMSNLEVEKKSKEVLVVSQQQAKKQLEKEQNSKNILVSNLKKKERQLSVQLQAKQKKRRDLNTQIQKIIQEEIRRSNLEAQRKAAKEGKSATTTTTSFALTPEEKALSASFEGNKGRLPWPTERGTISSSFGTHAHPVIKNVSVTNNGIDIVTVSGSAARAVFNGEVSNVGTIYGLKFIMIRHGAYTTVYSNLDQVYVSKGQKVSTKQSLGRIFNNTEEGKTELQFQIWKGVMKLDPNAWISR
ncbi:MAG: peptidoglycan DD-metalloendopeptidase family protein [Bacteroidales bacterium]